MDVLDRRRVRKKSFKERLGFKTIACCGGKWGLNTRDEDLEDQLQNTTTQIPQEITAQSPTSPSGMNLAAALAAERHFRATTQEPTTTTVPAGTPLRVSLMRLLEESENGGDGEPCDGGGGGNGNETMCCVCMGRKKGAAFIPCGHTFCRVCSRELWLNRGSCPLCNRSIIEILDIF